MENCVFLDTPPGTGKTFLINLLLTKMKMANKEHIAVASSGIAATLLLNCRTAHSIFKIPIQLNEDSICSIKEVVDYPIEFLNYIKLSGLP